MRSSTVVAFTSLVSLFLISLSSARVESSPSRRANEASTIRRERLIERAKRLGDVREHDVIEAVDAAIAAETDRYPAEILIAIAWGESRLISSTITGHACGPMQTIPKDRRECRLQQLALLGFLAGVRELEAWGRDRFTQGRLELVLLGYAAGYDGFVNASNPKRAWPAVILWRARFLGYNAPSS